MLFSHKRALPSNYAFKYTRAHSLNTWRDMNLPRVPKVDCVKQQNKVRNILHFFLIETTLMFIHMSLKKGGTPRTYYRKDFNSSMLHGTEKARRDEHLTRGNFVSKCKITAIWKPMFCFALLCSALKGTTITIRSWVRRLTSSLCTHFNKELLELSHIY